MAENIIVLSPRPGHDYKKTRAGKAEAKDDFLASTPFTLGLSSPHNPGTIITRDQIFKTIRERGVAVANVIIFNHSKSEILRLTLECTYTIREG